MRTRRAPAPAPCAWPPALWPRGWNGSLRRPCFPPSVRPAASLGVSAPRRRLPAPRAGSSPLPPRPRCVRPAAVAPVRASLFSPPPSCSACDRTPLQPSHTLSASSTHFSLFCLNLKSFWPHSRRGLPRVGSVCPPAPPLPVPAGRSRDPGRDWLPRRAGARASDTVSMDVTLARPARRCRAEQQLPRCQ